MNFAALNSAGQHLSDEAIAACADWALTASSQLRAERHLAVCSDCNQAVIEQREAASALRSAVSPSLPSDLLQRLRNLPMTTDLPPPEFTLSPEGNAVFPTFRPALRLNSSGPIPPDPAPNSSRHQSNQQHLMRRHSRALLVSAAALMTVGTAGIAAATTSPFVAVRNAPAPSVPARFAPAAFIGDGTSANGTSTGGTSTGGTSTGSNMNVKPNFGLAPTVHS